MAKIIKDIRNWGFPSGQGGENKGFEPFIPVLKRMLKAVGVGYKDPCCPDEAGSCSDPCGYIQTISTDDLSTISISGLDGAAGNTIDLTALIKNSETLTEVTEFSLSGNVITLSYKDEDGVVNTKTLDLSTIVPNLQVQSGSYDDPTNTITFVTADGTTFTVPINELTSFKNLVSGNRIATYVDENESETDIFETVTVYNTLFTSFVAA